MPAKGLVSILLLCYNSVTYLPKTLAAIGQQTYPHTELIIIDNCSTDGTVDYLKQNHSSVQLILNESNNGYCRGHNQGIQASNGEFVLVLNPDVLMTETFVVQMVECMELDPRVGIVSGKLYRIGKDLRPPASYQQREIDSAGLSWTLDMRHPDRGAGQFDTGQFDKVEYVFGASGAAPLLRRTMLADIAFEGEYFDEDFYFGHEDADLCWRAQIAGWKAVYTPNAVAYHVRTSRPDNRRGLPQWMKTHSIKNRFMIRMKNMSLRHFFKCSPFMLYRDMLVLGYITLFEPYSLQGLRLFLRLLGRNLDKRRFIMLKRRVPDKYVRQWFG